jgi:hypothetical protein
LPCRWVRTALSHAQLRRAEEWIDAHLMDVVGVDEVAAATGFGVLCSLYLDMILLVALVSVATVSFCNQVESIVLDS